MPDGPKLTTFHEWDVSGVKKGAAVIDAEYKKLLKSEQMVGKIQALNEAAAGRRLAQMKARGTDTKKVFENIGWSIRDLIEGRTGYAFVRMTKALGGLAVAGYGVYRAFKAMNDEVKKAHQQNDALQDTWQKMSYTNAFSTSSESGAALRTKRAGLDTQIGAERSNQMDILNKDRFWKSVPILGQMREGYDLMRKDIGDSALGQALGIGPSKTRGEISDESAKRQMELQKERYTNFKLGISSEQNKLDLARASTGSGDPLEAKRKELEIQKQLEISQAKQEQASKDEVFYIGLKYDVLEAGLKKQEVARTRQFELSKREAMLQGSSGSALTKTLGAAKMNRDEAEWQLENGRLNPQERHAAQMQFIAADAAIRGGLASRYIDPVTGKKIRNSVIQKQFRNERNAARRMAAFQRRVDRGEFNLETGRRTGGGVSGGGSLPMGLDDFMRISRMSKEERMKNPGFGIRAGSSLPLGLGIAVNKDSGGLNGKTSSSLLEKLISVVMERLPRDVAK